jgi:hypothetical protein
MRVCARACMTACVRALACASFCLPRRSLFFCLSYAVMIVIDSSCGAGPVPCLADPRRRHQRDRPGADRRPLRPVVRLRKQPERSPTLRALRSAPVKGGQNALGAALNRKRTGGCARARRACVCLRDFVHASRCARISVIFSSNDTFMSASNSCAVFRRSSIPSTRKRDSQYP